MDFWTMAADTKGDGDRGGEHASFYLWVSRMHAVGCAVCILLYAADRLQLLSVKGWWVACAPFFASIIVSRGLYHFHSRKASRREKLD